MILDLRKKIMAWDCYFCNKLLNCNNYLSNIPQNIALLTEYCYGSYHVYALQVTEPIDMEDLAASMSAAGYWHWDKSHGHCKCNKPLIP